MSKKFATNKLRIPRNKSTVTIALALVLAMATFITCLPAVNAVDYPSYAWINVRPNPVGVGQTVLVSFWLATPPPTARAGYDPLYNWNGFEVTITDPNGHVETKGPYTSDATGGAWFSHVPNTVGTYYFQLSFPGQTIGTNYFKPTTSPKVALTVQQEPVLEWPAAPLPTDYWTRPIEAENREWSSIAGNWLMGGYNATSNFNPYTKAPNTAHIVWTKPTTFGGLVGGDFGTTSYGPWWYSNQFTPPTIINGRLYYNEPVDPRYGFYCVDLRTGETLWWRNFTAPSAKKPTQSFGVSYYPQITLGQLYYFRTPNQMDVAAYLWSIGSTYSMYDAWNGNWICDFANASTGTATFGPNGELLVYRLNGVNDWLAMWNSSKAINPTNALTWGVPTGQTVAWKRGVQWNVTIPHYEFAGTTPPQVQAISKISRDVILATVLSGPAFNPQLGWQLEIGYDAKTGAKLWGPINRTLIPGSNLWELMGGGDGRGVGDGVYTEFFKETMQWYGYDLYTGEKVWGPTEPYANAFGSFGDRTITAYGKLFAGAFDGMCYCYDLKTGEHLWDFWTGSSGLETPYGTWPLYGPLAAADGKVFVSAGEHSPTQPLWRGGKTYALDVETGKEVWSISSFQGQMSPMAIADGYLVLWNVYDQQIYCFGKGQTATTVSVTPGVTTNGSSVLIQGTVTDQSPGAEGTPAISDQYMTPWMEYLYQQKPMPNNVTGVPVQLQAVGSDGSITDIGTVTSDAFGNFKYAFCPTKPDVYTILATFAGSDSYYASYASTGAAVSPSPPATTPAAEQPAPDNTPLFAGIIAAVAVGIVAIVLVLYTLYTVKKQRK